MNILAFDTTAGICRIALKKENDVVVCESDQRYSNTEALIPLIKNILDTNNCLFSELDYIVVDVGPGSFTGIRIGIATARGLSLASNVPVIGVTNFEIIAYSVLECSSSQDDILIIFDTYRDGIYCQLFNYQMCPVNKPLFLYPEQLKFYLRTKNIRLAGDNLRIVKNILCKNKINFSFFEKNNKNAKDILNLVLSLDKKEIINRIHMGCYPLYIKKPNVTLCKNIKKNFFT